MAFGRVLSALRDFIVVIGFITILSATHQHVKDTSNCWCYTAFSNGEFGCFSHVLPFDMPVRMLTQRWSRVRSKAFMEEERYITAIPPQQLNSSYSSSLET